MSITHELLVFAVHIVESLGYTGVAICMVLNAMGIPLSSEVILPLSGLLSRQGTFNLALVSAVAFSAQITGQIISYYVGAKGGVPLIERYGKYILMSTKELDRAQKFFARFGRGVVVGGFCIPFLRGYVGYVAGVAEMPFTQYIASALVGTAIWTGVFIWLGFSVATNIFAIEEALRPVTYALLVAIVLAIAYYIYRRLRSRKA